MVPVSTDKGLCGGINSTVSKYARGTIAAFEGGGPLSLVSSLQRISVPSGFSFDSPSEYRAICLQGCQVEN